MQPSGQVDPGRAANSRSDDGRFMERLAACCEAIAGTTKKLLKTAIVADYLKSRTTNEAAVSAIFLSGRAFPAWEESTLQVGGRSLWQIVAALSGRNEAELTAAYRRHGDLGAVAGEVLPERAGQRLNVLEAAQAFRLIAAARGPAAKAVIVRDLISRATPVAAKYIVKIMTGDLRIGLKESLVEDAIARAYGGTLAEAQRANMLLGDIGETLRFASEGRLAAAEMRLFHPLGFMLASPIESAEEGLSYFAEAAVEDKYDGIRAQAHVSNGVVKFFSRTRDDITESFPELPDALAGLPQQAILDGEIVAWSYLAGDAETEDEEDLERRASPPVIGRALPFSALQQRLGRRKVSNKLMRQVPVAYLVFDVLYGGCELLIDRPLRERARVLEQLVTERNPDNYRGHRGTQGQSQLAFQEEEHSATARVLRAPVFQASSPEELNQLFDAAQARGNEGLMIKDPESPYTPGRRGKSWLKLKHELATLDVSSPPPSTDT